VHPLWVTTPMVERGRASLAFGRLRRAMKGPLGQEVPLAEAASLIAEGILKRRRRIFVPGWVRWLFVLRSALHTRPLEREQLEAAPELEQLYLEDVRRGVFAEVPRAPPLAR
jgi:hypothetical protein